MSIKIVVYQDENDNWVVEKWDGPKLVNKVGTSSLTGVHKLIDAHLKP